MSSNILHAAPAFFGGIVLAVFCAVVLAIPVAFVFAKRTLLAKAMRNGDTSSKPPVGAHMALAILFTILAGLGIAVAVATSHTTAAEGFVLTSVTGGFLALKDALKAASPANSTR